MVLNLKKIKAEKYVRQLLDMESEGLLGWTEKTFKEFYKGLKKNRVSPAEKGHVDDDGFTHDIDYGINWEKYDLL